MASSFCVFLGRKHCKVRCLFALELLSHIIWNRTIPAPVYSHSPNRIYATVKNGELKYLSFYDENHNQIKSIDFDHAHNTVRPHVHFNMDHGKNSPGISPSSSDWALINKIKKEMGLK